MHSLSPVLGALQDSGIKVALVTDGRMSGASGKVPSAIHVAPEAARGGALSKVQDGDMILVDCETGVLEVDVDQNTFQSREFATFRPNASHMGLGRELFSAFRAIATDTETGASLFNLVPGKLS